MFVKAECVVRIGGDYVAWHEIYTSIEYVFGYEYEMDEYSYDAILKAKGIEYDYDNEDPDYDPISHVSNVEKNTIVRKFVEDFEYDGSGSSDLRIMDCALELDDNGKVLEVYVDVG